MKDLFFFPQNSFGNWFIKPSLKFNDSKCACFKTTHLSRGFSRERLWLRSESCWVKSKILQKDLQRRWEPSSHRSGKFEIFLTSVIECDRLKDGLCFWCFNFPLELFGPTSLKEICNLMSWILIGDDLNLRDWSSQNCQLLCKFPRRMLELVLRTCHRFSLSSVFHSRFTQTRWADRRKVSSPLLSLFCSCNGFHHFVRLNVPLKMPSGTGGVHRYPHLNKSCPALLSDMLLFTAHFSSFFQPSDVRRLDDTLYELVHHLI